MKAFEKLLLENKAWSAEKKEYDPEYFERMSVNQTPEFLWIGCSDSRVPAEDITNTEPGQIFVQRNIANLVVHTDLNLLSVLHYAVVELKVKHIIVCGHYGCGGVKAAMGQDDHGILNKWLRNIKEVYSKHYNEVSRLDTLEKQTDKMVELNVIEQIHNLSKTGIVQRAWAEGNYPSLHGWVYSLKDGLINPLIHLPPNSEVNPIFKYQF